MKKRFFSFLILFVCFSFTGASAEGDYYQNPALKSNGVVQKDNGGGVGHEDHGNGNGYGHEDHGNGNGYGHDKVVKPINSLSVGDGAGFMLLCAFAFAVYVKLK